MNNKILVPALFIFLFLSQVSYAQPLWFEQTSGVNRELTDVSFVDQNHGWISGWTGTILKTTNGGQTWDGLPNVPPNNAYYSVFFSDTLNGWASGYAGKIIHTTDGGETWISQISPVTQDFNGVYFIDVNVGWAVGGDEGSFPSYIRHRTILHTTDGGNSWGIQYGQSNKSPLESVYFINSNNGFAAGRSGIVMHTTNGGSTWNELVTLSGDLRDINFTNENLGFIAGDYSYRTTDGGNNWIIMQLPTTAHYSGVYFPNELNGWAVGGNNGNGNGVIYHSTDGGADWLLQSTPALEALYAVYFVNSTAGWAVGHIGQIAATENSTPVELTSFTASVDKNSVTLNWQTASETNNLGFEIQRKKTDWENIGFVKGQETTTEENSYTFADQNLAAGKYQYRLKQIDYDGSFEYSELINVQVLSPTEYTLDQNYPNPFNPSTTITYSIPDNGNVRLAVYNSIGEEIKTLVNEFKTAGSHEVELNAQELTSGIYFYRIESGEFSSVKKMVLLK